MNAPICLIHLEPKTMHPTALSRAAYEEAACTWLCTGCASPRPQCESVDVHIQEDRPRGPMNMISGCGLSIARLSFLQRFGEERVGRDLYLGKVYGPDGSPLEDWVTYRGKRSVVVRGSEEITHRVCGDCGRHIYFAMGIRYLCPMPPDDAEVFESEFYGLLVQPEVAEEAGISRGSQGVWVKHLKVLGVPRDGLPINFSEVGGGV